MAQHLLHQGTSAIIKMVSSESTWTYISYHLVDLKAYDQLEPSPTETHEIVHFIDSSKELNVSSKALPTKAMDGATRPVLVTEEPVELEKYLARTQDFGRSPRSSLRNAQTILQFNEEKPERCQHACNRLREILMPKRIAWTVPVRLPSGDQNMMVDDLVFSLCMWHAYSVRHVCYIIEWVVGLGLSVCEGHSCNWKQTLGRARG